VKELTQQQINRQDDVDKRIHYLVCALATLEHKPLADIPWDIEFIGSIRDCVEKYLQQHTDNFNEDMFYPSL